MYGQVCLDMIHYGKRILLGLEMFLEYLPVVFGDHQPYRLHVGTFGTFELSIYLGPIWRLYLAMIGLV